MMIINDYILCFEATKLQQILCMTIIATKNSNTVHNISLNPDLLRFSRYLVGI